MRAFVPPPPFWRHLTAQTSPSLRPGTVVARFQDDSPLSSVARLRAMQEAILKRRAALQVRTASNTSSKAPDPNEDLEAFLNSPEPPDTFISEHDAKSTLSVLDPTTAATAITGPLSKRGTDDRAPSTGNTISQRVDSVRGVPSHEPSPTFQQQAHNSELIPTTEPAEVSTSRHEAPSLQKHHEVPHAPSRTNRSGRVVIPRFDGRLPRHGIVPNLATPVAEVELPYLTQFLPDPNLTREDGNLPKVTFKNIAFTTGSPKASRATVSETTPPSDPDGLDCSSILENLNEEQRTAVLANHQRACIVLAGPGSGKTRVLTHRIAYLLRKYNIAPQSVLAVTFTNKAASEMRNRVASLLGRRVGDTQSYDFGFTNKLTLCTFHSLCLRLLREFGQEIGISPDFQICDISDSRTVVSRLRRDKGLNGDGAPTEDRWRALISRVKNGILEEDRERMFNPTYIEVERFRKDYDAALRAMNCLDFDDLLLEARKMLQQSSSVLSRLQDRYQYVLVDEWQDTNQVQFDVVSLLSSKRKNLFVVGDADQSIYKFRGANSGNLETFSDAFVGAEKVMLAQNYRSTACIVKAAQAVISEDPNRPPKEMKTSNRFGAQVKFHEKSDDRDEARYVVTAIQTLLSEQRISSLSECAVLFRKNAQSRAVEEACIQRNIAYRLLSGTRFYDRKEVKDVLGYIRLMCNPEDNVSFERIVNTPPRGAGKKTVEVIEKYAAENQLSLYWAVRKLVDSLQSGETSLGDLGVGQRQWNGIESFNTIMKELNELAEPLLSAAFIYDESKDGEIENDEHGDTTEQTRTVGWLMLRVMEKTGYRKWVEKANSDSEFLDAKGKSSQALDRLDNLKELVVGASRHSNMRKFLDHVTMMNASDQREEGGSVSLMTLHGGKGLEFDAVFIVGVENGLIPMKHDESDVEEERRLLYVGMTRARKFLTMTWRRNVFRATGRNETRRRYPSPFLKHLPANLVKRSVLRGES